MKLTNEMREGIKERVTKSGIDFIDVFALSRFYWFEDIPSKKIQNVKNSYASALKDSELIFLHDFTVFGSAKEGYLLTTIGIFFNSAQDNFFIPIENIDTFISEKTEIGFKLIVKVFSGEDKVVFGQVSTKHTGEQMLRVSNLFTEIFNFIKSFSVTSEDYSTTDEQENTNSAPPSDPVCPQCSTPIEKGEKFCSGCGAKIPEKQAEPSQSTSTKKPCANCKKDLEPNWTVCPYCQTKVITLTCRKCGKELQEEWLVCPYCNTKTGPKLCAGCGKELQDEWKVCPYCSAAVEE